MGDSILLQQIAGAIIPILFAVTVHEVAHGWVAKQLGDPTAQRLGRLTLNPIKHVDPVGTILIPGVLLLLRSPFMFGWAKPVPVTWENLRRPKRDMAIVAAAGPMANLIMAVGWAFVAKLSFLLGGTAASVAAPFLEYMGRVGVEINLALMILNLLPVPPLDGGRVAVGLLPGPLAWRLSQLEPYGFFILLALIATGALTFILLPPIAFLEEMLVRVVGLQ